jgi:hypothetical protein
MKKMKVPCTRNEADLPQDGGASRGIFGYDTREANLPLFLGRLALHVLQADLSIPGGLFCVGDLLYLSS